MQPLRELLRYWREQRGLSQLDLALEAGVSQRHMSFVESGRSVPSRALLLTLADAMDVPLRERNTLLLAAGYAPLYRDTALDGPEMALVLGAVGQMMRQHEPHPALLLDRHWNVLRTNEAAPRFFGSFVDLQRWPRPRNLLRMLFDPEALRPFVENWEAVAAGMLQRVAREAVGHVPDKGTRALLAELERFPGVRALPRAPLTHGPVVPITFARGGERWSYFSLITTVGMPQAVAAQELRLECMFPMEP